MFALKQIGHVSNNFNSHVECLKLKDSISEIIIHEEYLEGLKDIEESRYLHVLFKFHLCENEYDLVDDTYKGRQTGIFASRSIKRPNNIGLTTVQLLERNGNKLKVLGLDALNGSPVLDIKPFNPILDFAGQQARA